MELLEQAAAAPGGAPIPRAATELAGVAPLPPRAPEVPEVPADLADRVGPLPRRPEVELTPSSLVALRECPLRWRLGSVEGVPEGPAGPRSRALGLAALRGRALHEALEDGEAHDPARVRARFVAIGAASGLLSSASGLGGPASGLGAPELELEAERVVAHAARVTADPALAAMLAAPGLVEQRFEIPHGGAVVRGQIDRLWWDREAREWVVVDWKSERVEGPAEVQRAVARHADQLLAYVWGADRTLAPLGHPPVRRAAIAFSELGGLVELPRVVEPDLRRFEQTVVEAVEWARRPLAEVSAAVLTGPTPRPCDRCGHRGRACVGRLRGPASAAE
jgi:hypothetical protein